MTAELSPAELAALWQRQALAHINHNGRPSMTPIRESTEWARTVHARQMLAVAANVLTGQHTTDEDSNTADELAAAGLRACCGQPSERHCR